MALWGNNDNISSNGKVWLNYITGIVTATGTNFGGVGAASTGDIIRFGDVGGTYFGDAVIVGIASTTQLTIGSTAGLSGAAIAGAQFKVSQLPKYTTLDSRFSHVNTDYDSLVYGISTTTTGSYHVTHEGWVGVTTYMGTEGDLRVKNEVLVAMSGINTATNGFGEATIYPTTEG